MDSAQAASVSGLNIEKSCDARANAWIYAFSRHAAKKKAARPGGPNDGTIKVKEDDSANGNSIQ